MTFGEWLEVGIREGWIGEPFCTMHDGLPMTFDEETLFEEGDDPCIPAVRLFGEERASPQPDTLLGTIPPSMRGAPKIRNGPGDA